MSRVILFNEFEQAGAFARCKTACQLLETREYFEDTQTLSNLALGVYNFKMKRFLQLNII